MENKGKVTKAKKVGDNKKLSEEVFISLSGKKFDSKKEYLESKLKRVKSKFSLGFRVFEALIKKGIKRETVVIKTAIDSLVKKENPKAESPKVEYLADSLITNRKKGYLGLISGGDSYRIENPIRKNLPKGDKSNGTIEGIVKFDLVKNS